MSERSDYRPGEFCWVDLSVPSTEAGAEFYNELIGWEWEQGPPEAGGYGMFNFKGKVVAGMGKTQSEQQPAAWNSYVCVEDAEETAGRVKSAGGTVMMEPFDVLDAGRMAVCQDPQGAFFCLWQPKRTTGAQLVNEVGTWTWNQLSTRDLDGAKKFYGDVFGWTLGAAPEARPDSPYSMWQVEGQRWEEGLGGAMEMGDETPAEVPSNWGVFLSVEDVDGAVATTSEGGGKVIMPVTEIPVGKLAVLTDPQGAALGIIEPNYPEPR
jgi:predicted enzyme related to lactoylglutathione lyase